MAHFEIEKGDKIIKVDKGDHIRFFGISGFIAIKDDKWNILQKKLLELKVILESELDETAQIDIFGLEG